jgi:hypothetical protein
MPPIVKCEVDGCIHNDNGMCIATDIEVNYDGGCETLQQE